MNNLEAIAAVIYGLALSANWTVVYLNRGKLLAAAGIAIPLLTAIAVGGTLAVPLGILPASLVIDLLIAHVICAAIMTALIMVINSKGDSKNKDT